MHGRSWKYVIMQGEADSVCIGLEYLIYALATKHYLLLCESHRLGVNNCDRASPLKTAKPGQQKQSQHLGQAFVLH